ncbi:MAG: type III-B CRISPR module-associated protein Cmr3 [Synergistaceae bacterium]|nr:type III-B CRISPR module-associated protein Cmr3 [Synergistaceae bacterium]
MKYRITPFEPLIMRDARPFGAGSRMHSLSWIPQTASAGAVRAVLWKSSANPDTSALRRVRVQGAFPLFKGDMYFPRPLDIVVSKGEIFRLRPLDMKKFPEGSGADMPLEGLMPCALDKDGEFKPDKLKAFWSRKLITEWLNDRKDFTLDESETLSAPARDERTHASIIPETGAAGNDSADGRLFTTTGLDFLHNDGGLSLGQLSIDIGTDALPEKFTAPLGGERRLAGFTRCDEDNALWSYPEGLPQTYAINETFRLVLATPAIFAQGWLPGWLTLGDLSGEFPGTRAKVQLLSAVTDRWQAVSGWDYEKGEHKPMRRAVPAGSVYFFKVLEGEIRASDVWLKSVCDDIQDINDGFGLGLTGRLGGV